MTLYGFGQLTHVVIFWQERPPRPTPTRALLRVPSGISVSTCPPEVGGGELQRTNSVSLTNSLLCFVVV